MKVILKADIKGVGKKDEVINASDGYARNFLFPKNLAVEANAENMSKLKAKKDGQINLNDKSTTNVEQETKHLSEDLSMMYASDLKMDIVFNLTQQYNNGVPFIPITADNLIFKYNINENVAQRLASEINTMVENYIHEKEYQKQNYTPFVLDGFEEETNSMGGKSR